MPYVTHLVTRSLQIRHSTAPETPFYFRGGTTIKGVIVRTDIKWEGPYPSGTVTIKHSGRSESLYNPSGQRLSYTFKGCPFEGIWEAYVEPDTDDDLPQIIFGLLVVAHIEIEVWEDPPPPQEPPEPKPQPPQKPGYWAVWGPTSGVVWPTNRKAYFFRFAQYLRYDIPNDRVDPGYPKQIHDYWNGWPSDWKSPTASVVYPSGKAYFFNSKGDYLRITVSNTTSSVDPGYPRRVVGNWGNWPSEDWIPTAAAMWPNGKVYFFNADGEYLRYDTNTHRVDPGYPRKIHGNWRGWPSDWKFPDGAIVWPTGKAYFFLAGEYIRYDIAERCVDPGYPYKVTQFWNDWPEGPTGW